MTEDMINKIIDLDTKSKEITKDNEDKYVNIEKYIKQELAIKESVMEVMDKSKAEKIEQEYTNKFKEEENKLKGKNAIEIQELEKEFEANKGKKIEELFQYVIKKVGE